MNKCHVCGGRAIKTDSGLRCMNSTCEGAKERSQEGVICECGETMEFINSSPYGDRNYACDSCGATKVY